jgi:hypothetical protein
VVQRGVPAARQAGHLEQGFEKTLATLERLVQDGDFGRLRLHLLVLRGEHFSLLRQLLGVTGELLRLLSQLLVLLGQLVGLGAELFGLSMYVGQRAFEAQAQPDDEMHGERARHNVERRGNEVGARLGHEEDLVRQQPRQFQQVQHHEAGGHAP